LASAFVSSLAIFSNVKNTHMVLKGSMYNYKNKPVKIPVTCSDDWPCPRGAMCMKLYGKEGLCVLHIEGDFE